MLSNKFLEKIMYLTSFSPKRIRYKGHGKISTYETIKSKIYHLTCINMELPSVLLSCRQITTIMLCNNSNTNHLSGNKNTSKLCIRSLFQALTCSVLCSLCEACLSQHPVEGMDGQHRTHCGFIAGTIQADREPFPHQ